MNDEHEVRVKTLADVYREALVKIAERDSQIECTSEHDWNRKVRLIAANALRFKLPLG